MCGGGVMKNCHRSARRNKLCLAVSGLGFFWTCVAAWMIIVYTYIIEDDKELPFDVPPPVQSPCLTYFCPFYGTCLLNATTNDPFCKCLLNCEHEVASPVCGSDRKSYKNNCELKSTSCNRERRIVTRHQGECESKKNPCDGVTCKTGAICVSTKDGLEHRCQCPKECSDYGDSEGSMPICGNNGKDYGSFCELQTESCITMAEIKIKYYGKCDPCDGVVCEGGKVCQLNNESDREPVCRCESSCEPIQAPVCGSDGNSYSNECMLRKMACETKKEITVLYSGDCRAKDHPCQKIQCKPSQDCVVNRMGQASCVCPAPCWQVVRYVCGSNGITYDNACELRRQSCLNSTVTTIARDGPCEHTPELQIQCKGVKCNYDAVCQVSNGVPECVCPTCKQIYDPVCGNNGISYQNDCETFQENCERQSHIKVEHRGLCTHEGCDRNKSVCKFYSVCDTSTGPPRCLCPSDCTPSFKVCGSDGVTYKSECELRVSSCKKQQAIYITAFEDCEDCNGVKCLHGAECVQGRCRCPKKCPSTYQAVCGSDEKTYQNECEMMKEACRRNIELDVIDNQGCDPLEGSGEESGDFMECEDIQCRFGGTCKLDANGTPRCTCPSNCDAVLSPVCGTDSKTYGNQCMLQLESCNQQMYIAVQSLDSCDEFSERLCDGTLPTINAVTGKEYNCTGSGDCPAGSYCHLQFMTCCNEEHLSGCMTTEYGCCPDGVTMATGPNDFGCEDKCHCNIPGSKGSSCNPVSKQCNCRPGVGGLQCTRCLPGYWGLQLIQKENRDGCKKCNCHEYGSSRVDCRQMTGRCMCNPGYKGLKCDICAESGLRAGRLGCPGESCADIMCKHGATCSESYGAQCVCDIKCPEHSPSENYVCGENGITYFSECSMRKDSCMKQEDIRMAYRGRCKDKDYSNPTAVPYTTRSRKTTRHIPSNYLTNNTSRKPKSTPRPPVVKDRIGNVCLEDSYCDIPNSECRLSLCHCKDGYIPTMGNAQCSAVKVEPTQSVHEDLNTCSLNPCLNGGVCVLDENLGYRCLCGLGRSGIICRSGTSFITPSFSGSSYLVLKPLGNISGDFYLDITFHAMNNDGILLYSSQWEDGTGQFVSIAISNRHVEFRFDMGSGPVQIRHPHQILRSSYHQVIAKKIGKNAMLVVDGSEPVAAPSIGEDKTMSLLGKLYLGYVPRNLSFIQEKIGVNLGFVGCIQSLTAGQVDRHKSYKLNYPSLNSELIDGLDIGPCERNPCQSLPCLNGGSCMILNEDIYQCLCPKGHSGANCEGPINLCTHSPCHQSATCSLTDLGDVLCHCPEGREGPYCEYEKLPEIPVPLFTGDSYLILHVHDMLAVSMSVEMWFLTEERDGMLVVASQYLGGSGDFISLNLDDLYLEFRYNLGDGVTVIRSTKRVDLNQWHRVVIQRTDRDGDLTIDGGEPYHGKSPGELAELQLTGSLYIGGIKDKSLIPLESEISRNFSGAIQRIYLNGRLIDIPEESVLEKQNIGQYTGHPCNMNPCINGGVCVPKLDQATCKCTKKFIGQKCEKRAENTEADSPIRFSGTTYLQYFNDIASGIKAQKSNKFQFRFHTHQRHGMLIFQNQGHGVSGDYFTIVISNSYVEVSYNLGKQTQENMFRVRSTVFVSDGQWHSLYAERDRRTAILQVDNEPEISTESAPGATQLDTDGMLWIGGKSDLPYGLPEEYRHGFKGCLGNVYLDNEELNLYEPRNGPNSLDFCH